MRPRTFNIKTTRAFTLVEVVISLSVATIVVLALQSSISLAIKSIPNPNSNRQREISAGNMLRQLTSELEAAQWIISSSANSINFVIPDRDNDGLPEALSYRWTNNGVGDVLRKYNSEPEHVVLANVSAFNLELESKLASLELPGLFQPGSNSKLNEFVQSVFLEGSINANERYGQLLKPAISSADDFWKPTSVNVRLRRQNASSSVDLRAKPALSNGLPTSDRMISASATVDGSTMPTSYGSNWVTFPMPNSPWVDRNRAYCVEFLKTNSSPASTFYKSLRGSNLVHYTLGSWQNSSLFSMEHELFGVRASSGATRSMQFMHLSAARISCQAEQDLEPISALVTLRNAPGQLSRQWHLNFLTSPLIVDSDASGSVDWQTTSGSVAPDSLSGGTWTANNTLIQAVDSHNFANDAIIDVTWKCVSTVGEGILVINAFRDGNTCRPVRIRLRKEADQTHYLHLENPSAASASEVYVLGDINSQKVKTRLVLNYNERSVTLIVNDLPRGCFPVSTAAVSDSATPLEFGAVNGAVEFSNFTARVWN